MNHVKFKDVGHLYLGCEVKHEYASGSGGIDQMDEILLARIKSDWAEPHLHKPTLCKPILRRLESLTDDELESWYDAGNSIPDGEWAPIQKKALGIKHLLAEKIDLFNLIDNGEAIDAATLDQEAGDHEA